MKKGESHQQKQEAFFSKETLFGFEYNILYAASSGCSRLIFDQVMYSNPAFCGPPMLLGERNPGRLLFFSLLHFFSQVNDGTKPGTGFHSECLSHIFVGLSAGISASTEWKTRVQTQSRACVEYTPWISVVAKSALWMERNTHRLQCFWKRKLEIFLVFELPKQFLRCEGVSCPIAKRVTIFKVIRKELATNVFGCVLGIHRSFKAAKKLSAI